jgi:hypothetical protein
VLQLSSDRTYFCECACRMWIAVESWKKARWNRVTEGEAAASDVTRLIHRANTFVLQLTIVHGSSLVFTLTFTSP